jgi:galactoside O-acetyltransferase
VIVLKFFVWESARLIRSCAFVIRQRYFFRKMGIGTGRGVVLKEPGNVSVGAKFNVGDFSQILAQGPRGAATIVIGNNVGIGAYVTLNADIGGKIVLGNDVRIGPYTLLRASNHSFDDVTQLIVNQGHKPGSIIIEDDVWVGGHVSIVPDVKVGRGSVIGAGSVVTTDIPEYSVAVGNPARVIRKRKDG